MIESAAELGFTFAAMASRCELRLAGAGEATLKKAADAAIAEVHRIEAKYSRYRGDSVVSQINAAAGSGRPVAVDDETAGLLGFAECMHDDSGGRFDATSGVLRRAWDFRSGVPPSPAAVDALLPLIGWSQVQWNGREIALPQPGMELDFGGFGKEYAADRAHSVIAAHGVSHGWVNLGGDIRVCGPQLDGSGWRFGIQHPREAEGVLASVELQSGALATSGDYERFFKHGGRRYCHLLDARTGWPVDAWQSISVIAPVCSAAGAIGTIAFLCGEAAPDFLKAQKVAHFRVDAGGRYFAVAP